MFFSNHLFVFRLLLRCPMAGAKQNRGISCFCLAHFRAKKHLPLPKRTRIHEKPPESPCSYPFLAPFWAPFWGPRKQKPPGASNPPPLRFAASIRPSAPLGSARSVRCARRVQVRAQQPLREAQQRLQQLSRGLRGPLHLAADSCWVSARFARRGKKQKKSSESRFSGLLYSYFVCVCFVASCCLS